MSSVDVVVPCYNYARFLEYCVDSILNQDGVDVRVLIIDDASVDDTLQVGQRLAELDRRVGYRRHSVNHGAVASFNEGVMDWASAKYTLLISADDALTPGALARAADLMDREPDVVMTYGMAIIMGGEEFPREHPGGDQYSSRIVPGSEFLKRSCLRGNPVPTPTAVVRTEVQHAIGGYRADLPHTHDMEMWMRFAVHGSIGVIRSIQGYYRKHGNNMSQRYYSQLLSDWQEVMQACDVISVQWGGGVPGFEEWREAGRRIIGDRAYDAALVAFGQGDVGKAHAFLDFAQRCYPAIRWSDKWIRLRTKLILGRKICNVLRAGMGWLHKTPDVSHEQPRSIRNGMQEQIGWWPDSR